jgi:hypothetical protein
MIGYLILGRVVLALALAAGAIELGATILELAGW